MHFKNNKISPKNPSSFKNLLNIDTKLKKDLVSQAQDLIKDCDLRGFHHFSKALHALLALKETYRHEGKKNKESSIDAVIKVLCRFDPNQPNAQDFSRDTILKSIGDKNAKLLKGGCFSHKSKDVIEEFVFQPDLLAKEMFGVGNPIYEAGHPSDSAYITELPVISMKTERAVTLSKEAPSLISDDLQSEFLTSVTDLVGKLFLSLAREDKRNFISILEHIADKGKKGDPKEHISKNIHFQTLDSLFDRACNQIPYEFDILKNHMFNQAKMHMNHFPK
jgi:hypothetical protein